MSTFISLLLALAMVSGFFAYMFFRIARGARAEAVAEQQGQVIDAIKDHAKIEADVHALPADAARSELRQWSRN